MMKGVSIVLLASVVLGVFALLSLGVGRYPVSPGDIIAWMAGGNGVDERVSLVMLNIRIPRLVAAVVVGGSLALSGASYQGLFRNPMVSPDILGVSSGSGFGAALGILLSLPAAGVQVLAFAGGISAVSVAVATGRMAGGERDRLLVLVLSGIVVSSLFGALLSMLKYVADPLDKLPSITFWLMGSLADIRTNELATVLPVVLLSGVPLFLVAWRLNVMSFGEDEARSLGVPTGIMRAVVIVSATLLTASVISLCGIVGWIGLVVPHIGRFLTGPDHRRLFPVTFLLGGAFLLAVDTIARSVSSMEIPLGIITAVIGAPFFVWVMKQSSKRSW
jgi:iron complex transport system permease protein